MSKNYNMETFKKCFGLCAIIIFITDAAFAAVINNGHIIHELVFLGSSDGKSFFSEGTVPSNWTEARAFCKASNLELAAIETKAQVDMPRLASAGGHPGFSEYNYWTSARDAHTSRQFSWDTTNAQPSENITLEWIPNEGESHPFESCALLQGYGNRFRMVIVRCEQRFYTLCQTPLRSSSSTN